MKTTIIALFCLLACATAYGKHGHARHHPLLSRAAGDVTQCNLTCEGVVPVAVNSSWSIQIVSTENSATIDIAYDVGLNIIVSIHHERQWGFAIDGATGLIFWFDLKLGGVQVVNVKTGKGAFFVDTTVVVNGSIQLSWAIQTFGKVIAARKTVTLNVDYTAFVRYLSESSDENLLSLFGSQSTSYNASFGLYVSVARESIRSGTYKTEFGVAGLLLANFDGVYSFGGSFVEFLSVFYSKTDGTFQGGFALAIYGSLTANGDASNRFAALTYSIRLIGSVYVDLNAAVAAYNSGERITSVDTKTLTIGSVSYVFTLVRFSSGNVVVYIQSSNTKLLITYVRDVNLLLFYNIDQGIVVAVSGKYGVFAVVNVKTGDGLIVKYNGFALVVSAQQEIVTQFAAGLYVRGAILISGQIERSYQFTLVTRNSFNLVVVFAALRISSFETAILSLNAEVKVVLTRSFKAFIAQSVRAGATAVSFIAVNFVSFGGVLSGAINGLFTAIGALGGSFSFSFASSFVLVFQSPTVEAIASSIANLAKVNFSGGVSGGVSGSGGASGSSGLAIIG